METANGSTSNSKVSNVAEKKEATTGDKKPAGNSANKATKEVAKTVAPTKPAKHDEGFVKVSKGLPVVDVEPANGIFAMSALLSLVLPGGEKVNGYYVRYVRDYDRPHELIKKGTGFFIDANNNKLAKVDSWSLLFGKVKV